MVCGLPEVESCCKESVLGIKEMAEFERLRDGDGLREVEE